MGPTGVYDGAPDVAHEPLVDVTLLWDSVVFIIRSVRRHVPGTVATLALSMSSIMLALAMWPETWQLDGRLLVQADGLVTSLVNPERAMARRDDRPNAAAPEIVKSRENMVAMIEATDLMAEWERTREPWYKWKDAIVDAVRGPRTTEQKLDTMVSYLDTQLNIYTGVEGTVSFVLQWRDPEQGRRIVAQAMENFLDFRRKTEQAAILDSIAILDRSAATLEGFVRATLAQMPRRPGRAAPAPPAAPPRRVVLPPTGPAPETTVRLARLRAALDERQNEVNRLEAVRTQQLAEAQSRLNAAQTLYTDGHPTVVSLRQNVSRLQGESAELATARREARALAGEFDALSTNIGAATADAERERLLSEPDAPPQQPIMPIDLSSLNASDSDPVALRLKNQMAELAGVQVRASAARAELASAEAAFKYEYMIVREPRIPREPIAPDSDVVTIAGLLASILLAIGFGVAHDILSGRVFEAWQVERQVRAPIAVRVSSL